MTPVIYQQPIEIPRADIQALEAEEIQIAAAIKAARKAGKASVLFSGKIQANIDVQNLKGRLNTVRVRLSLVVAKGEEGITWGHPTTI